MNGITIGVGEKAIRVNADEIVKIERERHTDPVEIGVVIVLTDSGTYPRQWIPEPLASAVLEWWDTSALHIYVDENGQPWLAYPDTTSPYRLGGAK